MRLKPSPPPASGADARAPVIRPAAAEDAPNLSVLALRSKAHWGYDAAFMRACIAEMAITPADLARNPTFVLADGPVLLGFAVLAMHPGGTAELDALFVAPEAIGLGYGRRLFAHAAAQVRAMGARTLLITADPHAEAFYLHVGAVRVGQAPSGSIPGRMLPRLALALDSSPNTRSGTHTKFG